MKDRCEQCGDVYEKNHLNQKFCDNCRFLRRKKNFGIPKFVTPEVVEQVKGMAGTMKRDDLAKRLGMHTSSLKRIANSLGISLLKITYPEDLKERVAQYYIKNGIRKTEKRFPGIRVRSIVERSKLVVGKHLRQKRWTHEERLELLKFAGLASPTAQARFFQRPRANAGSIKSAWSKTLKAAPSRIHGMHKWKARMFVRPCCPSIKTEGGLIIYPWTEMEKYLVEDCPDIIKLSVSAMADFQRKLFGEDPYIEMINIQEALK